MYHPDDRDLSILGRFMAAKRALRYLTGNMALDLKSWGREANQQGMWGPAALFLLLGAGGFAALRGRGTKWTVIKDIPREVISSHLGIRGMLTHYDPHQQIIYLAHTPRFQFSSANNAETKPADPRSDALPVKLAGLEKLSEESNRIIHRLIYKRRVKLIVSHADLNKNLLFGWILYKRRILGRKRSLNYDLVKEGIADLPSSSEEISICLTHQIAQYQHELRHALRYAQINSKGIWAEYDASFAKDSFLKERQPFFAFIFKWFNYWDRKLAIDFH